MSAPRTHVVAAFDLDGTLTEGGSVFRWLRFVAGNWRTWRVTLRRVVPLAWGALRSGPAADSAKESLFQSVLLGRPLSLVTEQSRDFATNTLSHRLRPRTMARLQWHLDEGHVVVLVSASPELYVQVLADIAGAHGAVATRLAVDPLGRLTGGYLGRNCRGEEKLRRLTEWIDTRNFNDAPELYAYGNSRGDRRMLAAASHGVDAGKLGRFGALRSYKRLASL